MRTLRLCALALLVLLLSSTALPAATAELSSAAANASVPPGWDRPHVALANNPAANEWMLPSTVNRRFKLAVDAGVNYVYLSPKWDELETSPGHYKFNDIDFQVNQADKAGLPVILHLRIIDTNRKTAPSDLQNAALDDPKVRDRLFTLLDQLAPHLKNRLAYCLFGNEIDGYFKAHADEIAPYGRLFRALRAHVQQQFPDVPTSVSVTFDGLSQLTGPLRPVASQTDFLALTYYPLTPDFLVRDPSSIVPDLRVALKAAGDKRVLLQEAGYPSSTLNNSSDEKQAAFVGGLLAAVAGAKDRFIGVNFLFMCDFSDHLTNQLAANYKLPNAQRFKSFLQTLGLFDGKGQPKKAWSVFQSDVPLLTRQ
jgi:hypothetical protein